MSEFEKTVEGVLDYKIDYTNWLLTDTITSSVWEASGLTTDSTSYTNTSSTIFLSGGNLGQRYDVKNTISTAGGRTDERCFKVRIVPCRSGYVI